MKADWEKLMTEFKNSADSVVGDVDCTGAGESLCQEIGVQGYPTIKHGDPNDLQDYEGGRSFADLSSWAKANLGPQCGPKHLDLCDAAKKTEITKFSTMSADELDAFIQEKNNELEKVEGDFKAFVAGLDKQMSEVEPDKKDALLQKLRGEYKVESDKKDAAAAAVKESGLGLAKSVKAFNKESKEEL